MIKVSVHGASFFAKHGYYAEEQLIGSRFVVDIDVEFDDAAQPSADEIAYTVNYEQLYAIAKTEMQETKKLLETVAYAILNRIRSDFEFVQTISVQLKKLNPPLGGEVAYSAVTVSDVKTNAK